MVVVDGPEGREVARPHGGEEVLPPATLQVHEAPQAPLGVGSHHLQTVRHVRLVKNPSEERGAVRGGVWRRDNALPAGNQTELHFKQLRRRSRWTRQTRKSWHRKVTPSPSLSGTGKRFSARVGLFNELDAKKSPPNASTLKIFVKIIKSSDSVSQQIHLKFIS